MAHHECAAQSALTPHCGWGVLCTAAFWGGLSIGLCQELRLIIRKLASRYSAQQRSIRVCMVKVKVSW